MILETKDWIPIGSALLTAVMTAVGLYFGPKRAVTLATKQFRAQKLWEDQKQCYLTILSSLSVLRCRAGERWDEIAFGYKRIVSDTDIQKLDNARDEIKKYLEHGTILLTEEAISALRASLYICPEQDERGCCEEWLEKLDKAAKIVRDEASKHIHVS